MSQHELLGKRVVLENELTEGSIYMHPKTWFELSNEMAGKAIVDTGKVEIVYTDYEQSV